MQDSPARVRWLALGEGTMPGGAQWLAPGEAARLAGLRYPKRRAEYLLRRFVAKHAIAMAIGRPTDPAALADIDVRNRPSGSPYALVDGGPVGFDVSITDRAGWAVCVLGDSVGCDLELVEPRTRGFVRDYLTEAEQRFVADRPAGDDRDAAANLVWSAKESALKVLGTGLRRDTRSVEITVGAGGHDGWGALGIHDAEGRPLHGWWRRDGSYLLTVAARAPGPPPDALDDPWILAAAVPRHSWLDRPLSQ